MEPHSKKPQKWQKQKQEVPAGAKQASQRALIPITVGKYVPTPLKPGHITLSVWSWEPPPKHCTYLLKNRFYSWENWCLLEELKFFCPTSQGKWQSRISESFIWKGSRYKHFYISHIIEGSQSSFCRYIKWWGSQHAFLDQHQSFNPNMSQSVFLMNKLPN